MRLGEVDGRDASTLGFEDASSARIPAICLFNHMTVFENVALHK